MKLSRSNVVELRNLLSMGVYPNLKNDYHSFDRVNDETPSLYKERERNFYLNNLLIQLDISRRRPKRHKLRDISIYPIQLSSSLQYSPTSTSPISSTDYPWDQSLLPSLPLDPSSRPLSPTPHSPITSSLPSPFSSSVSLVSFCRVRMDLETPKKQRIHSSPIQTVQIPPIPSTLNRVY